MRCSPTATSASRRSRAGGVNIGIVLGPSWRTRLARDGRGRDRPARSSGAIPPTADDPGRLAARPSRATRIAGAVAARPSRDPAGRAPGWLLVGDAAGFLDPFTGEGLHRALVSAELAARGDQRGSGAVPTAPTRLRGLRPGDAPPVRVQGRRLVARPGVPAAPGLFEYAARRLAVAAGRPCDDGPRDGRSRPGQPRARSALPRRAARAVRARCDTIGIDIDAPPDARLRARPRTWSAGPRCSPTTRDRAVVAATRRVARSSSSSRGDRSSRSWASASRSPGGRGPGTSPTHCGSASCTSPARRAGWTSPGGSSRAEPAVPRHDRRTTSRRGCPGSRAFVDRWFTRPDRRTDARHVQGARRGRSPTRQHAPTCRPARPSPTPARRNHRS